MAYKKIMINYQSYFNNHGNVIMVMKMVRI